MCPPDRSNQSPSAAAQRMTGSVFTGRTENELISLARLSKALGPVARETSQSQTDKTGREVGHASTDINVQPVDLRLTSVMRRFVLLIGLVLGISTSLAARANQSLPFTQTKAANLARMRAESLNGGLGSYRAAGCMYETGAPSCLASQSAEGLLFSFQGGSPGWEQKIPPQPSVETRVLVSRDGDRILDVPYNGPLR